MKNMESIQKSLLWGKMVRCENMDELIFEHQTTPNDFLTNVYQVIPDFKGVVRMRGYRLYVNHLIVRRKLNHEEHKIYLISKVLTRRGVKLWIWHPTFKEIFHLLRTGDKKYQNAAFTVVKRIEEELIRGNEVNVKQIVTQELGRLPYTTKFLRYNNIICPDDMLFCCIKEIMLCEDIKYSAGWCLGKRAVTNALWDCLVSREFIGYDKIIEKHKIKSL